MWFIKLIELQELTNPVHQGMIHRKSKALNLLKGHFEIPNVRIGQARIDYFNVDMLANGFCDLLFCKIEPVVAHIINLSAHTANIVEREDVGADRISDVQKCATRPGIEKNDGALVDRLVNKIIHQQIDAHF